MPALPPSIIPVRSLSPRRRGGRNPTQNTLAWGKLRYGKLVVTDTKGKVVPATLKSKGDRILIAVNDAHAAYPLTIDPLVWIEQKVTADDGAADDDFGDSIALDGTTAVIGAPKATVGSNADQGAAYIFTESDSSWSESQKLIASDGAADDNFGIAVAIDGTTAVIGANNATVGGNTDQGAAYVFTEAGGTWSESQKLTASDGAADNDFGYSVALAGTTAVIGAPGATVGGNAYQGAAYVFIEAGGTWSESRKLTASDGAADDLFGYPVALDGVTAVIGACAVFGPTAVFGAIYATVGGNAKQGAAYVFTEAGGIWSESRKLTASDGAADDDFGYSVALDGTTAVIGAPYAIVGGNAKQGAAYFYGQSDLDLAMSAPAHVNPNDTYTSQTIATNNASAASPAVAITVTVPAVASFVSANATQGSCNEASGVVSCDFGAIDGNAGMATATVTLKATGSTGTIIENTASVAKATPALTASASTMVIPNNPPVASDGTLTTNENTVASATLNATDPDGDPLTFGIVTKPNHGSVTLDDSSTGAYTYTPNQGFSGSDSFTFKANDGQADSNTATISITVKAASHGGGGGGGGATGPLGLALLVLVGLLALLRRKH